VRAIPNGFSGKIGFLTAGFAAVLALVLPIRAFVGPAQWDRYSVLTPAGPEEPDAAVFRQINGLIYSSHRVTKREGSSGVIAQEYGTTVMSLQTTNNSELMFLHPGAQVTVHNKTGKLYQVSKEGETLDQIVATYYGKSRKAQDFKQAIVESNGLPGIALLVPYELGKGDALLLPHITVAFDTYHFPFKGGGWGRISSKFGMRYHPILHRFRFHDGFDIPKPWGTPVFPARNGIVVDTGWHGGYGLLIVVRHSNGETTRYGHLSKVYVHPGERVVRGKTLIGRVGSTGLSTGPHLHFEVRDRNGHPVNPAKKIGRS